MSVYKTFHIIGIILSNELGYLKIPLQIRGPVQKFLTAWWKVKIMTRVPDTSFIEAE